MTKNRAVIQNVAGQPVTQSSRIPAQTTITPRMIARVIPSQTVRQSRSAIPAGAMTSVKTSRTPTIWLASVTETARTIMKAAEWVTRESPLASARRGWMLAKNKRREKMASTARLSTERNAISATSPEETPKMLPKRIARACPA
jgi:hypothetical protein